MFNKIKKKFLPGYLKLKPAREELTDDYIVNIQNLSVSFKVKAGMLHAVREVSIKIKRGEILGIVGESGSGKSVTSKTIMGILKNYQGKQSNRIRLLCK